MDSKNELIASGFEGLLGNHDRESLTSTSNVVYGLWSDYRLAYLNPGWFAFAEANEGEPQISEQWGMGRSIMDSLPGVLRPYYEEKLASCLSLGKVWSHEFECSSDTTYRRFHQTVYPLAKAKGLLVVNSLAIEHPHDPQERLPMPLDDALYLDGNRLLCQCAYCRRVKNFQEPDRWDWVPAWVKVVPKNASHTYCPTCFAFYFS